LKAVACEEAFLQPTRYISTLGSALFSGLTERPQDPAGRIFLDPQGQIPYDQIQKKGVLITFLSVFIFSQRVVAASSETAVRMGLVISNATGKTSYPLPIQSSAFSTGT